MSDHAKIVKSNNFIPLAKSQIVSNSSKKEANQPQSSSLQINNDNFVSKEENTELMCLEFENRFGKLPPQDLDRLTYLQTKSDHLFYEQHRAQLSIMRDLKNRAKAKDRYSSNRQKPEISEIDPQPKLSLFTEEERVRLKPLVEQYKKNRNGPRVNRIKSKLTIGKPGDKYEQEADRVADLVTNAPDPLQRQDLLETDEELRAKSLIQRSENIPTEEDEVKVSSLDIQRMDEASLDYGQEELIPPQSEISNLSLEEEEILQNQKSDFENKSNTEDSNLKQRWLKIADNLGLESDLATNSYDDLGEKAVKYLLEESKDEIAAAMRSVELERIDEGHSLKRHGPQLDDDTLKNRLTKGKTPGDSSGRVKDAPPGSTRFNNFKDWEQTRNAAWEVINLRERGALVEAPSDGDPTKYQIVVQYDRPIGKGYVGLGGKTTLKNKVTGKKINKIYTNIKRVETINLTKTIIEWDETNRKWKIVQHFPPTSGLPDVGVKL